MGAVGASGPSGAVGATGPLGRLVSPGARPEQPRQPEVSASARRVLRDPRALLNDWFDGSFGCDGSGWSFRRNWSFGSFRARGRRGLDRRNGPVGSERSERRQRKDVAQRHRRSDHARCRRRLLSQHRNQHDVRTEGCADAQRVAGSGHADRRSLGSARSRRCNRPDRSFRSARSRWLERPFGSCGRRRRDRFDWTFGSRRRCRLRLVSTGPAGTLARSVLPVLKVSWDPQQVTGRRRGAG